MWKSSEIGCPFRGGASNISALIWWRCSAPALDRAVTRRAETTLSFRMSAMPIAEQASSSSTALDLTWVRSQFPALAQTVNGHPAVFLDGPGGTQVPQQVIDAIADYLSRNNANTGGAYHTSRSTDRMIAEARSAMGDFLNCDADEIVFGPNMTTLTFAMSRAHRARTRHPATRSSSRCSTTTRTSRPGKRWKKKASSSAR